MSVWLVDDEQRLKAVADAGLLDTPRDAVFDDFVERAARICAAPVALISLIDRDRQWFKAALGTDVQQTPVSLAICAHALGSRDILVIPDLAEDARTRDNPLVTGLPHVRFYAGAPLADAAGSTIGTLCVLDVVPRPAGLTADQIDGLDDLRHEATRLIFA